MNSYLVKQQDQRGRSVANTYSRSGTNTNERKALPPGPNDLQERFNSRPQVRQVAQLRQALNAGSRITTMARKENRTGIPARLKAGIEALSRFSLDGVRVLYNSAKPAQFHAHAITQGKDIHLGPGRERDLPHEAWHVVQQQQGRVQATTQMHGVGVNTDSELEREADVMGERAAKLIGSSTGLEPAPMNFQLTSKGSAVASEPVGQRMKLGGISASSPAIVQMNGDQNSWLKDMWKTYIWGPHSYRVSHQVHTRNPGETDEEATRRTFEIIRQHPAPFSFGRESTEEGRTMWIPPFGQINTMTNPPEHYLTNVTMPGRHFLHPGDIRRTAVGEHVVTEGSGYGLFPRLNERFADPLWGSVAHTSRKRNDPEFARQHYEDVLKKTEEAMKHYQ